MRVVLYDRDCGFCRWSLDKILAWDRDGALQPVAIQSEEGERLLRAGGVPEERWLESWHLVLPEGDVVSAGEALPYAFDVLPGGHVLARLARAFPRATDWGYGFVVRHRTRLGKLVRVDASCTVRRT